MPSNYSIAKQLKRLGDYLAICGRDPGYYAGAAFLIQGLRGQRVDQLSQEGRLHEIELNEEVARVVEEICLHGTPKQLEQPIDSVPLTVLELVEIPGLGEKTARRLWTEAGIGSLDALATALDTGRLDAMKGVGPKLRETMRRQITKQKEPAPDP